jgi:hypothetical protein
MINRKCEKLLQIFFIYCRFLHDSKWDFFFQPASMDMDKREIFRLKGVLGLILFSILTFVNKINWGYEKYLKVYE